METKVASVLKSINPYNEELISEFEEYSDERLEEILDGSVKGFKEWRKTGFKQRSELLLKLAGLLRSKKENLGKLITREMGKPVTESIAEIEKCAWVCDYYAENAEEFLKAKTVGTDAANSYVAYEPLGTVLAVMPWNFPFWQVFRFAAPNIMAGNVGLLKHASNVSICALEIESLFREAGAPEEIFQTLILSSSKMDRIIEDERVKAVTLTGSEKAGSSVAEMSGRKIKKTVLELGGSNAFIVLDDADIDKAVDVGVKARMQNTGQSCIAAKRFILLNSIAAEYIERFTAKVKELKAGNPLDNTTQIGPLARTDLAKQLEYQVRESATLGAHVITGGNREGAKFAPTVLTNVKPGMPAFDEETFGPAAAFTTVENIEEAINLSNRSKFGLGVTLFTSDIDLAMQLAPQFDEGAVFVNELVKSDPRLPFGGVKCSGYGRELSEDGIKEFVNKKTVYIA